ncbi:MAG: ABC transporter permease [Acidobacteria bacterium]|nr:ABC transporter permease [Acidobacteriota bacterium]
MDKKLWELNRLLQLWRRLLFYLRRNQFDRELEEEMKFHLEMKARENLAAGMSAEEARYASRRQFGNQTLLQEVSREMWSFRTLETLGQDIRYGLRMLVKHKGFTVVAVLTLALGIGANTAIFSVINALILNPPHIAEAERVAAIWRTTKDERVEGYISYLELQDWRAQNRSFEAIAGYKPNGFILLNDEQAERLQGMRVTANFLTLLKVNPIRGRDFQVEEEKRGAQPVVIISHKFWQNRLGSNEAALGQQISLNSKPFTIIGILPPGFEFPLAAKQTELITTIAGEGQNLDERGAQVLRAIGRLRQGVTFAQAQAELTNIAGNLEQQYPQYSRNVTAYLVSVDEQIVGLEVRRALWVLLGAVGCFLLIACTNVTNLLLVRASARQKELALRVAVGAGTWRIARQLLTESLLLALLSGGAGLLLAIWGLSAIRYFGAELLPRLDEVQINTRVLVFTLAVSVLTAIICSLVPVFKAARPDINEVLKAGSKTATSGGALRLWRDSLVVAEVALGLMLLIGAGLMMRSFGLLVNVHPGFEAKNVLTGRISMTRTAYEKTEERVRFVDQTLDRLKALPGVESAAFVAPMPFSGGNVGGDFRIEGRPKPEPGQEPSANVRSVTSQYFQAIRIPLRKGRYFTERDKRSGVGAAIINETLAGRYFPNEDPLGKRISNIGANQNDGDPEQWEIVGVIGDVHHSSLTIAASPELYLPFQQNSWNWGNFFVRTTNDPTGLTRSFSDAIRSGDKTVPVTNVQPLTQAISDTVAQERFYTLLFALFGVTGLLMTLTGIYGVISYTVSQQTQEIGIRMALGAQARDVMKLVIGQGLVLTLIGIGLGLLGALGVTQLMQTLLYRVSPTDPLTFAGVAATLALAALVACYVPARRAAKVDPLIALRYE